jgi:LysR family transcriptional regulator, glycine cleavage system transcriptional activator
MDRRLPPLIALRAFEAAARYGSMRQAATAMSVSHSVISRHVSNLEDWLGVPLFVGSRRAVALTPEGRRYFNAVTEALDRIASATEEIRPVAPWQTIDVWCVSGLASRWLVPKLAEVRELIPDVDITIRPTLNVPDFARGEADLFITYGPVDVEGLWETKLMSPIVIPVASPAFIEGTAPIREASDFLSVPLLHEVSADYWRQWFVANGVTSIAALKGPRLWHLSSVLDAAKNGQGVALAPEIVVRGDIREGHLQRLGGADVRIGSYHLYTKKEAVISRSLAKLRQWIVSEFSTIED